MREGPNSFDSLNDKVGAEEQTHPDLEELLEAGQTDEDAYPEHNPETYVVEEAPRGPELATVDGQVVNKRYAEVPDFGGGPIEQKEKEPFDDLAPQQKADGIAFLEESIADDRASLERGLTQARDEFLKERTVKEQVPEPPTEAPQEKTTFTNIDARIGEMRPQPSAPAEEPPQQETRAPEQIEQTETLPTAKERLIADFGISAEQIEQFEDFDKLSTGQQNMVLENLTQYKLSVIEDRSKEQFRNEAAEASFTKKVWRNISKGWKLAKLEQESKEQLDQGGLATYGGALENLIAAAEGGPGVRYENDKRILEFAPEFEGLEPEQQETLSHFNTVANTYAQMPESWGYPDATKREKKQYEAAQQAFEEAKVAVADLQLQETSGNKLAAIHFMSSVDEQVWMQQHFATNKDTQKELANIDNPALWRGLVKTAKDKSSDALKGYVVRSGSAFLLGAGGAVLAGGLVGGYMGRKQAKRELMERDTLQRKGEADTSQEASNFVEASSQAEKLEHLITRFDTTEDPNKQERLLHSMEARIDYIERKKDEGRITYGKEASGIAAQAALIKKLSMVKAKYAIEREMRNPSEQDTARNQKLLERLDMKLDATEEEIASIRNAFKSKGMRRGAAFGLGFALLGASVRSLAAEDVLPEPKTGGAAPEAAGAETPPFKGGGEPPSQATAEIPLADSEGVAAASEAATETGTNEQAAPQPEAAPPSETSSFELADKRDWIRERRNIYLDRMHLISRERAFDAADKMAENDWLSFRNAMLAEELGQDPHNHTLNEMRGMSNGKPIPEELQEKYFGRVRHPEPEAAASQTPDRYMEQSPDYVDAEELEPTAETAQAPTHDSVTQETPAPPGSPATSEDVSEQEPTSPEAPAFTHTVEEGDNLWNIIKEDLEQSGALEGLDERQRLIAIDQVEDRFEQASPEQLKKWGIASGNPHLIQVGEEINLKDVYESLEQGVASANEPTAPLEAQAESVAAPTEAVKTEPQPRVSVVNDDHMEPEADAAQPPEGPSVLKPEADNVPAKEQSDFDPSKKEEWIEQRTRAYMEKYDHAPEEQTRMVGRRLAEQEWEERKNDMLTAEAAAEPTQKGSPENAPATEPTSAEAAEPDGASAEEAQADASLEPLTPEPSESGPKATIDVVNYEAIEENAPVSAKALQDAAYLETTPLNRAEYKALEREYGWEVKRTMRNIFSIDQEERRALWEQQNRDRRTSRFLNEKLTDLAGDRGRTGAGRNFIRNLTQAPGREKYQAGLFEWTGNERKGVIGIKDRSLEQVMSDGFLKEKDLNIAEVNNRKQLLRYLEQLARYTPPHRGEKAGEFVLRATAYIDNLKEAA